MQSGMYGPIVAVGSRFETWEPPAPQPQRAGGQSAVALAGKRVVIVEDEVVTQMQLRKILARNGLTVVSSTPDGAAGVAAALRERPDIVLMDIRLPGDMDGLEAARRILSEVTLCVIMLTAVPNRETQDEARGIGASGYIIKPIDRDTLFPQMRQALETFRKQWG